MTLSVSVEQSRNDRFISRVAGNYSQNKYWPDIVPIRSVGDILMRVDLIKRGFTQGDFMSLDNRKLDRPYIRIKFVINGIGNYTAAHTTIKTSPFNIEIFRFPDEFNLILSRCSLDWSPHHNLT